MIRRQGIQFWMNLFQELTESGFYDGEYLDQEISRFCFLRLVQVRFNKSFEIFEKEIKILNCTFSYVLAFNTYYYLF